MAVYSLGDSEQLLMVSDDGTLQIRGEECKKLKDPMLRRFRVVSLPLNQLIGNPSTAQVAQ
jgi:hypothetical protein